jgi:ribosomal protein S18 acetylase RimI-like enzyme
VHLRDAQPGDAWFLAEMLAVAVDWRLKTPLRSAAEILRVPEFAHYVTDWPRLGDAGVVAIDADEPIGAAWYRFLAVADRGFGYVADDIPEVTIGVDSASRRRGVGEALLRRLIERACAANLRAVSLSVEDDNPAIRLYERLGFGEVGKTNGATTMLHNLARYCAATGGTGAG